MLKIKYLTTKCMNISPGTLFVGANAQSGEESSSSDMVVHLTHNQITKTL